MKIKHINKPIKAQTNNQGYLTQIEYITSLEKLPHEDLLVKVVESLKNKVVVLYSFDSHPFTHLYKQHQENLETIFKECDISDMSETDLDSIVMTLSEALLPLTFLIEAGMETEEEYAPVWQLSNFSCDDNNLKVTISNRELSKEEKEEIQYLLAKDQVVSDKVNTALDKIYDTIIESTGLKLSDKQLDYVNVGLKERSISSVLKSFLLRKELDADK